MVMEEQIAYFWDMDINSLLICQLGAEIEYVFGGIDNNVLNRRSDVQLATQQITNSNVKGTSVKLGGTLWAKNQ